LKIVVLGLLVAGTLFTGGRGAGDSEAARRIEARIAALEAEIGTTPPGDITARLRALRDEIDRLTARLSRDEEGPSRGGSAAAKPPANRRKPAIAPASSGRKEPEGPAPSKTRVSPQDQRRSELLFESLASRIPDLDKDQRVLLQELLTETAVAEREAVAEAQGLPDAAERILEARRKIFEERDRRAEALLLSYQFEKFRELAPRIPGGAR